MNMYPDIMRSGFEEQSKQKKNIQKNVKTASIPKARKFDSGVDLKEYILMTQPTKAINAQTGQLADVLSQVQGHQELLVSKSNGKLLLDLHFKQDVCISRIFIVAPQYNAPQTIKLFINCEVQDWVVPWQGAAYITTLTMKQFRKGASIQLGDETNFGRIKSLQLEVQTNQSAQGLTNMEPTIIQNLVMYGKPSNQLKSNSNRATSYSDVNTDPASLVLQPLNCFRTCGCISSSLVQTMSEIEEERQMCENQSRINY